MLHAGKMESPSTSNPNRAVDAHMVALEPGRFGAAKSNARDERAMVRSGMDSVVRCDRASSRKGRLLTANRAALRAAFKEDWSAKNVTAATRESNMRAGIKAASAELQESYGARAKVRGLNSLPNKGESTFFKPPENRRYERTLMTRMAMPEQRLPRSQRHRQILMLSLSIAQGCRRVSESSGRLRTRCSLRARSKA